MKTRMLSLLVLAVFTPQSVSAGGPARATPWIMTGVVRNAAGQPLEGVDVSARNTVYYNMNVVARTDRQGRYRIALPHEVGTWAPYATIHRPWGDQVFQFTVYPGSAAPFGTSPGASRGRMTAACWARRSTCTSAGERWTPLPVSSRTPRSVP